MICSITATFIILYNSTVSLHFSIVIMIIKNCLGSCSGRNSLSVIFPWQWQRTFRRPVFSWQQPWEAWLFSLLNACEKTNKSRQQVSWVGTQELVRRQLHRLRLHVQNILCFALVHKKKILQLSCFHSYRKRNIPWYSCSWHLCISKINLLISKSWFSKVEKTNPHFCL